MNFDTYESNSFTVHRVRYHWVFNAETDKTEFYMAVPGLKEEEIDLKTYVAAFNHFQTIILLRKLVNSNCFGSGSGSASVDA